MKKDAKTVSKQIKGHVKGISAILVAYGVGEIMGNVLKEYKPDAKGLRKALIKIGAVALTGMVIKSVTDYVNGEIDEVFDMAEEAVNQVNAMEEELNNDSDN